MRLDRIRRTRLTETLGSGDIAMAPVIPESKKKSGYMGTGFGKQNLGVEGESTQAASFAKTSKGKSVSCGGDKPPQSWGKFKTTTH